MIAVRHPSTLLHLYLPWTSASAAGLTVVVHSTAPAERVVDDVRSAVRKARSRRPRRRSSDHVRRRRS